MSRILVIGATSAIAEATCRRFAANGYLLFLTARNGARLDAIAGDLRCRGAEQVFTATLDANDWTRHEQVIHEADRSMQGIDIALIAHGALPDQKHCEASVAAMLETINTNGLSTIALMTSLGNYFEQHGRGVLAVISSVAGDRGRQSNYVYGTAKAAVSTFAQGLRHRLSRAGISVITIKPGLVDTPMTASFKKGALWASPETVATRIERAIDRREDVVYTPWFWRWIMLIIKVLPEPIFKKTRL